LMAHVHTPDEALVAGYVDEVVPAADVMTRALAEANRLGAFGRMPYRATKERLRGRTITYIKEAMVSDMKALMFPGG
ncbi:MAG: hypothetical protein K8M05_37265, partial [Deltaproteobacteria bacterium]|nr:hypothetical protein [Kofleriaceae bacterium]